MTTPIATEEYSLITQHVPVCPNQRAAIVTFLEV